MSYKKVDWGKIVREIDKKYKETKDKIDKEWNRIIANGKK